MTSTDWTPTTAPAQTSEGAQEMTARSEMGPRELLREVGSVLRMSEAEAAQLGDLPDDPDEEQTMIINMGPQHPSTHGVLRLMLELQGETVLRCKPIIGYLHTGMEKTGEQLTFMQGGTNVTRMDYLSPMANELVFSMATEKLLGIDGDIPERAVWMRMLLAELQRAGLLARRRGAPRGRDPGASHVDPDAHERDEPHLVASAVHGHQRHGPRRRVDDDLRLA